MNTNEQTAPSWVAGKVVHAQAREEMGRNWVKAVSLGNSAKNSTWAAVGVVAMQPGIAALTHWIQNWAQAMGTPQTLVHALGHDQWALFGGFAAFALTQSLRVAGLEVQHRRLLSQAVNTVDPVEGTHETLWEAARNVRTDDFSRLVAIKALQKQAKTLSTAFTTAKRQKKVYQKKLAVMHEALDTRLDEQAVEAARLKQSSPFSTEEAQAAQKVPLALRRLPRL